MGTLGEKQDKPIYAKASPPRFGFYWQQCHHGNEREPHQLDTPIPCSWQCLHPMQLDTVEPIPCRHAALTSPRSLATFTADQLDTTAHNVNRADQLRPLATMPDKPTLHSRHHWQQCHRPAIARAY